MGYILHMNTTTDQTPRNIEAAHCQSCGSTRREDVADLADTQGYTRCCNERVVCHRPDTFGRVETCAQAGDCYHD